MQTNDQFWGYIWFGYHDVADRIPAAILSFSKYESMCLACGRLFFYDERIAGHTCDKEPVVWMANSGASNTTLWICNPVVFANLCRAAIGNLEPLKLGNRHTGSAPGEPVLEGGQEKAYERLSDELSETRKRWQEAGLARAKAESNAQQVQEKFDKLVGLVKDLLPTEELGKLL